VSETVSERMGRRACLPQMQVRVGMAFGLHRSAEHLELTRHLIVPTPAARGRDCHGTAPVGSRTRSGRSLAARPSRFRSREAAMRMAEDNP
jgi:hypothetical protein